MVDPREGFGCERGRNIASDLLRQFVAKRQVVGAQPATINRNMALLSSAMNIAREDGIEFIPKFPMLSEIGNEREFFGARGF